MTCKPLLYHDFLIRNFLPTQNFILQDRVLVVALKTDNQLHRHFVKLVSVDFKFVFLTHYFTRQVFSSHWYLVVNKQKQIIFQIRVEIICVIFCMSDYKTQINFIIHFSKTIMYHHIHPKKPKSFITNREVVIVYM